MRTDLFDFELPEAQIAAFPSRERGADRLLVLERAGGRREHHDFSGILGFLKKGDLLVVNDTKVRRARLSARKTGGGQVEVMLLAPETPDLWLCLTRSNRPLRSGSELILEPGLSCRIEARDEKTARVRFSRPLTEEDIERLGNVPLPPYIIRQRKRSAGGEWCDDNERYQTVFAAEPGAVAAPTAGLHFTSALLAAAGAMGVGLCRITLEVGWGTFAPVEQDNLEEHRLHEERYRITSGAAEALNRAREEGRRIIAVGTTVVRTLEAACGAGGFAPGEGTTDIFIKPGYRFRVIDALLTNFHTPRSTLLMLVAAFAGREAVLEAYREAVTLGYRFYSYGDVMFIH